MIGLLAVLAGSFIIPIEGVSSGLIGGGILLLLWDVAYTWQYWLHLNKYLRLTTLGIVLIVLFYLAYKRFENVTLKKK